MIVHRVILLTCYIVALLHVTIVYDLDKFDLTVSMNLLAIGSGLAKGTSQSVKAFVEAIWHKEKHGKITNLPGILHFFAYFSWPYQALERVLAFCLRPRLRRRHEEEG